jgi:hypothetical protein
MAHGERITPDEEQIIKDLLKKDPTMGRDKIFSETGGIMSTSKIKRFLTRYRKEQAEEARTVEDDIQLTKVKKSKSVTDKKYKEALNMIETLEAEKEYLLGLQGGPGKYKEIKVSKNSKVKSEAAGIIVCSDWHIEELVDPDTVNGLNDYNLSIMEERWKRYIKHSVKLFDKEAQSTRVETLVFAILGDMMTGYLHEECLENNQLSPLEAAVLLREMLHQAIDYFLKHTDVPIKIPCCYGNHGRLTKKKKHGRGASDNLEWMLYNLLAVDYKNNPRVDFAVSKGYLNYVSLFDKTLCFHHGDNVRYGGGVGGLTIPMNKANNQWNKSRPADLYVHGHFHQQFDHTGFVSNGSGIGWNAFAVSIKAEYQKPRQTFFLYDRDEGKTGVFPIVLHKDI